MEYYEDNMIYDREIGMYQNPYYGDHIIFKFLNGTIGIPDGPAGYGAYAVCPGCGSGKTTLIRDIIRQKWNEGILYAAFTIQELNDMYDYCKSLVGSRIGDKVLELSDIVVLHSDNREGLNIRNNDPYSLMSKRIILCTHHKLLNDPITILVGTDFVKNSFYTSKFAVMNGLSGSSLPRQWILIDEGLEVKGGRRRTNKSAIGYLGNIVKRINRIEDFKRYELSFTNPNITFSQTELNEEVVVRDFNSFDKFYDKAKSVARICSPELKSLLFSGTTELEKIRDIQIAEELFDDYEYYMSLNSHDIVISYGFHSLSFDEIKTHMLLFDGTSDITLKNSRKFKLLTYDNKYSGNHKLNVLPFELVRNIKPDPSISDYDQYLRDKLEVVINRLIDVINSNTKTLIFTWMNFKVDNSEVNDDTDPGLIVDTSSQLVVNRYMRIPEYIKSVLESKGYIYGERYSIEYYGSGRDKAINDYRDYDSVVLLGKYTVPRSVIDDFNLEYRTNVTFIEYYLNRVIQAICRTRIRLHKSLGVNIYMSSDWSADIINGVRGYLGIGSIDSFINTEDRSDIDYMYGELRKVGITPSRAEKIAKLCCHDRNIFTAIINSEQYELSIKLDEIFRILPVSRKTIDKYSRLCGMLRSYRINLTVVS